MTVPSADFTVSTASPLVPSKQDDQAAKKSSASARRGRNCLGRAATDAGRGFRPMPIRDQRRTLTQRPQPYRHPRRATPPFWRLWSAPDQPLWRRISGDLLVPPPGWLVGPSPFASWVIHVALPCRNSLLSCRRGRGRCGGRVCLCPVREGSE